MLTKNEKMLIADTLNGCNMLLESDPTWLKTMTGDSGAIKDASVIGKDTQGRVLLTGSVVCSGLEHQIYDAIRLNALDDKWQVDGCNLIHNIREMTPGQRAKLILGIATVWSRNDENFEHDLEHLNV